VRRDSEARACERVRHDPSRKVDEQNAPGASKYFFGIVDDAYSGVLDFGGSAACTAFNLESAAAYMALNLG